MLVLNHPVAANAIHSVASQGDDYPEPVWWVEALSLYENDREVLLSDQELTILSMPHSTY